MPPIEDFVALLGCATCVFMAYLTGEGFEARRHLKTLRQFRNYLEKENEDE